MAANLFSPDDSKDHRIRSAWLMNVMTSCQHASACLSACDRNDACDLLGIFTTDLQLPSNQAEWLVLRGLLLDVAVRASATQHVRLHGNASEGCGLKMECLLHDFALAP